MAGQHYRARRPGPANLPAAAMAVPTDPPPEPVVPTVVQPGCPARPSPERLPVPGTAPRHLAAKKKAARSDPTMARRPPGRASYFAAPAGTGLVFPRQAGTVAAVRAFPSLRLAVAPVAPVARAFPSLLAAATRVRAFPSLRLVAARHPSLPAAEKLPVSPSQAGTVAAAQAFPTRQPAARRTLVFPREPAAAVAARAFPTRQPAVGLRLHPNHPAVRPSPAGPVGQPRAASASH